MTSAISIRDLVHHYPLPRSGFRRKRDTGDPQSPPSDRHALNGVSFDVLEGEIFGVLGPNGSGKTTLFRILATLMRPTRGGLSVFDCNVATQSALVRRQLGIVFQTPSLDVKLTAEENLMHQGHLYGLSGHALQSRVNTLLNAFALHDRRREYVERFSGGMRRRVELAKALLHRPRVLLMDEPATGLDPGARRDLWNQLRRMRSDDGVTIALTTHLMDEADHCDRLAVLSEGQLVAVDTPDNLKRRIGGDVITIEPEDPADLDELCTTITQRFGPWPSGGQPTIHHDRVHLEKEDGASFVTTVSAAIVGRARSITVGKPTLEDVFLHLTGHTLYK